MHTSLENSREEGSWQWEAPSVRLFLRNMTQSIAGVFKRRPLLTTVSVATFLVIAYMYRHTYQPYALLVSIYADVIAVTLVCYVGLWVALRRYFTKEWMRTIGTFAGIALLFILMWHGAEWHQYVGQYWRYQTLQYEELAELPLTDPRNERALPLEGVRTIAAWRRDQTETVTRPDFIRTKNGYCWSMAVEPDRLVQQWTDPVDEVLCIPGTEVTPDLSTRGQIKVRFEIGENLLFSRNTNNCVRRALGPLRFFSYEPGRVVYIPNDAGQWVQVVPWIKWTGTLGFLFPRPEFGGVQIIEQEGPYPWHERWTTRPLARTFRGCGAWIPPQEMHKHAYLRGQNLMPDAVSRSMAESFRFQEGFTAPWRIFKGGDVRIADFPDDINQQPFTSFYRMPKGSTGEAKLYDSFALEPHDTGKRVLHTSFFVPGDGIGPSYVYRHSVKNEAPLGVTAIPEQIRADGEAIFWMDRRPIEHRFYIRDIADSNGVVKRRLMYLTTIVLVDRKSKDGKRPEFVPGSIPKIAITDSDTSKVAWVDAHLPPELWEEEVRKIFGPLWGRRAH